MSLDRFIQEKSKNQIVKRILKNNISYFLNNVILQF